MRANVQQLGRRRNQSGQVLVFISLAMVAVLAVTALVLDSGYAFVQQRRTQNAMDAASEAGAMVLSENLVGFRHTDTDVLNAVTNSASTNSVSNVSALYTNVNGNSLGITVGSLGSNPPPASAAGVRAAGSKTFNTMVGGIVGLNQFTASAKATAVTGNVTDCALSQGCTLIPLTFSSTPFTCTGTDRVQVGTGQYPIVDINNRTSANESTLKICFNADGSVGWLAITPENGPLGTSELAADIAVPDAPDITFPIWINAVTGSTNNGQVDTALNSWDGKVVEIPFYDCIENDVGQLSPGPACPTTQATGIGSHTYFHIIGVYGFYLDHAYINSNPNGACGPGGNGATRCILGWFVQPLFSGTVGQFNPNNPGAAVGIQLVR
jgi:hypothetical protein